MNRQSQSKSQNSIQDAAMENGPLETLTDPQEIDTSFFLDLWRWAGIFTVALCVACILAISFEELAQAQAPMPRRNLPRGFQQGNRNFNPPAMSDNEASQRRLQTLRNRSQQQQGISVGGQADPADVPEPRRGENGIEVGGSKNDGLVSNTEYPFLKVDTATGDGSNAVVTDFNYPDADILNIAKTIGKLTGKSFIFDKNVKGRISIVSNGPITVSDAWRAFLTALDINGYALIPSGKYIRIARVRDARDKQLSTYVGEFAPSTDALITRVFALKHITADEVARTFRSFMPANSRIIPYAQTNTVIVTDTGSNIAKLAKMLEFLDIEGYDAGIEVVRVQFAAATDIAQIIDSLLPGSSGSSRRSRRSSSSSKSSSFSARRTKGGGLINTIIADERTNSLIVHANPKGAEHVRHLVSKLDLKDLAPAGGGKIHVIYLQYADAKKLSETLNSLSQQSSSSSRRSSRSSRSTRGASSSGGDGLFEGAIKVSADEATNSLVVTASPSDFATLQRVINKLDIPRDEVYVEVIVMEILLNKQFNFSSNLALPTSGIGLVTNQSDFASLFNPLANNGAILGLKAGGTTQIDVGGQATQVSGLLGLIRAVQTHNEANILATPQILTLDNEESSITIEEKVPIPETRLDRNGNVQGSIGQQNIGINIKIKPHINKASNFVRLDVETKFSDFSTRELQNLPQGGQIELSRETNTKVNVADRDTVIIGGLIREKINHRVNKIPLLGDIPLLGWLFRSKEDITEKTNLLIFLTPHVIRHYEKVRGILEKKMKQREEFIDDVMGGKDPMAKYKKRMLESLPEVEEFDDLSLPNEERGK